MTTSLFTTITSHIYGRLFLPEPALRLTDDQRNYFDNLIDRLFANPSAQEIKYEFQYPKHEFLRYLTRKKKLLLHGSNNLNITELVPKPQMDWKGRPIKAVFASGDGIWPMFFATVQHTNYRGSFRNGCFVIKGKSKEESRFYFFSLNKEYKDKEPWQDGMIYLLPKEGFQQTSTGNVRFDEWANPQIVKPIAKLRVSPEDFPFKNLVSWHDEKEKIYISWLKFKKRIN